MVAQPTKQLSFLDDVVANTGRGERARLTAVPGASDLRHLKLVSKAKLEILRNYLPSWARILGSANEELCYVDCFAGPGRYETREGIVDGSAVIGVSVARNYVAGNPDRRMRVILMDKDAATVKQLRNNLIPHQPFGPRLAVEVHNDDSTRLVPALLQDLPRSVPAFFTIDPYSHPLSVPVINSILRRPRSEVFVNLMFYRINQDLANPATQHRVDRLFGHRGWRSQPFMHESGWSREHGFLSYFCDQLRAQHVLPFRILFDEQEDRVKGDRTKYYLLHCSNHPRAMLLMKEVMWPLGDEAGTFQYAASSRSRLISQTPDLEELRVGLLKFFDRYVAFDDLRVETAELPFIERHYRAVIKHMIQQDLAEVIPVDSKTTKGLRGRDKIRIFMV